MEEASLLFATGLDNYLSEAASFSLKANAVSLSLSVARKKKIVCGRIPATSTLLSSLLLDDFAPLSDHRVSCLLLFASWRPSPG